MDVMQLRRNLLMMRTPGDGNLLDINETPVVYRSSGGALSNDYTITNGVITADGATNIAWPVNLREEETYTFSISTSYGGGSRLILRVYYSDEQIDYINASTVIGETKNVSGNNDSLTFTVPPGTDYVYAGIFVDYRIAGTTISELKLVKS